jgi:hypothetical protein
MPMQRQSANATEHLRDDRIIWRVEILVAPTSKKNVPRDSVLNKDIKRVKFNKDIIISGKFTNRE